VNAPFFAIVPTMTLEKSTQRAKRIVGLFPALLGVGGVQEAGRLTAAALHGIAADHEWSCDLLTLNDPPGMHILGCEAGDGTFRGFGRAKAGFVLEGMRQTSRNAHIILAAHPNLAVPAAFMHGGASEVHTIVMAHGVEVWNPLPALVSRALRRAKIVLAPSRYTAGKLVEVQGIPQEKVRLLPWPLSPDFVRMAAAPAELRPPPSFPKGRVVLTVGRWASSERYKGADALIQAVPALRNSSPDACLVAVGTGDDLPRLRQISADLNVANHVHFLEGLSRQELAACYARADVFALPSTGEGFGLVFLEAMAFGKPVVGAAAGGATDLIEDGRNGFLVPPRDVAGLAQALERLLSDSPLRETMGQRGAQIVRERHQFDSFRRALEAILGDCGLPLSVA
jgi:phosphatidylinositol alpha-1,6-mannosyltransferase